MNRRRKGDEAGMTLVEVLVAATILVLGIGATVTALNGSRRLVQKSERKEQALSYAQADVERFRSVPWEKLGTDVLPTAGDAGDDSTLVISVGGTQVLRVRPLGALVGQYTYQRLSAAVSGGIPQAETVTIGNSVGRVERIVSQEETCALNTLCTGAPTARRVTVRVQLQAIQGVTPAPVVAEAVIANPT